MLWTLQLRLYLVVIDLRIPIAIACCGLAPVAGASTPAELASDLARELRSSGCGAYPGQPNELRRAPHVDEVARRMAEGLALGAAADAAGLDTPDAAAIQLRGALRESSLRSGLEQNFCEPLTRPGISALGSYSDGDSVWLVVAADDGAQTERAARATPQPRELPRKASSARRQPSVPAAARPPSPTDVSAATVLRLVNAARARPRRCGTQSFPAAASLRYSEVLEDAADIQALDMARASFIDHTGSDGSSPTQRLARTGYQWRLTGENLALGPTSSAEVVQGWLGSPGHCANLMDARFTEMGLARRTANDAARTPYWAMTLAVPKSRGAADSQGK